MDPKTALQDIIAGMPYANDARRDLNEWLAKGGFAPRVELSPATDAWMMGDRFGEVVKVGTKYLHVKMDRSGRTLKISPQNIYQVI